MQIEDSESCYYTVTRFKKYWLNVLKEEVASNIIIEVGSGVRLGSAGVVDLRT